MSILCIVTGASRGLGRSIATALAGTFPSLHFVLVARDAAQLAETERQVKAIQPQASTRHVVADLGVADQLESLVAQIVAQTDMSRFERALLINNVGSVGDLSSTVAGYSDAAAIQQFITLNMTSVILLTSAFLKLVQGKPATIVNISSLMAVQAFPQWGLYCMSKAGRDLLHSVVAKEEKLVKTLNYAPGPLDTEMQHVVRTTIGDASQRSYFSEMHDKNTLVDPNVSAGKLVRLLEQNTFESGAHLDFYDI
ncbi:sepiapterin reductase [Capsaspora owczarzaki ATCC 30864]|uniref:Sepiapterin reductase n=1 Tax=Capsaspora owczarzaki (strain ATCC 30864) TaxID=595528 RepID=A0A0D2VLF9_CAPO3|nr:sepiapterin reductase [Capsaspora owczarzaki ATCC 30864]KJE90952.1 sepiapterin reductase [Capsaspora owczarzaki ATCC 30864]|eukprot:XP_004348924.1 sepiapterin reductase [Capsaspora owczarzaki ATCC 30864]